MTLVSVCGPVNDRDCRTLLKLNAVESRGISPSASCAARNTSWSSKTWLSRRSNPSTPRAWFAASPSWPTASKIDCPAAWISTENVFSLSKELRPRQKRPVAAAELLQFLPCNRLHGRGRSEVDRADCAGFEAAGEQVDHAALGKSTAAVAEPRLDGAGDDFGNHRLRINRAHTSLHKHNQFRGNSELEVLLQRFRQVKRTRPRALDEDVLVGRAGC